MNSDTISYDQVLAESIPGIIPARGENLRRRDAADGTVFFRVENGFRFSKNSQLFRKRRLHRLALDFAAFSGAAAVMARVVHLVSKKLCAARAEERVAGNLDVFAESFTEFGCWADDIRRECSGQDAMGALPGAAELNALYSPNDRRFVCIRVLRHDHTIGWAVLLNEKMRANRLLGDMHIGCIVDCMALPGEQSAVIEEATRLLRRRGVDLIATKQSDGWWRKACGMAGFIKAPVDRLANALTEYCGSIATPETTPFQS